MSSRFFPLAAAAILTAAPSTGAHAQPSPTTTAHGRAFQIVVTLAAPHPGDLPHDGRLLLAISTDSAHEPRLEISDHDNSDRKSVV
jgi:hypothetical protein